MFMSLTSHEESGYSRSHGLIALLPAFEGFLRKPMLESSTKPLNMVLLRSSKAEDLLMNQWRHFFENYNAGSSHGSSDRCGHTATTGTDNNDYVVAFLFSRVRIFLDAPKLCQALKILKLRLPGLTEAGQRPGIKAAKKNRYFTHVNWHLFVIITISAILYVFCLNAFQGKDRKRNLAYVSKVKKSLWKEYPRVPEE